MALSLTGQIATERVVTEALSLQPFATTPNVLLMNEGGTLVDRTLAPGEWRPLTQDEVRALERAAAARPRR